MSNLDAKETNIVLKTSSGEIKGTLTLPEKEEGIPVVLIISGSGPTDRNGNQVGLKNNSLQFFSDELRKNGIATVRYDKRGVGESSKAIGKESDLRYSLFRSSVQPYMIFWMKYNPQEEIKKLNVPVLIIQGMTDIRVLQKDAQLLAQSQPRAELKIIQNMNHVLKDCSTVEREIQIPIYSNPELPLNKNFVTEVVRFIQKINSF